MAYKTISAQYPGKCKVCGQPIAPGDVIVWESLHKVSMHPGCKPAVPTVTPKGAGAMLTEGVTAALKAQAQKAQQSAYAATLKVPKAPKAPKPVYSSILAVPNPTGIGAGDPPPATQKGKGIHVLQHAGILPKAMGIVCTTLETAIQAFGAIPGDKFCRPCPITARHGFVDSRVVKDIEGLKALWAETKAADPLGELIVMPLVKADYNCVWRPGLLAIGPGHDGATAGQNSISVFMQEAYSPAWAALAIKAGVNPDTQAPFIEGVSHEGVDTVVTQIRAGVRSAPTEPDWIPAPMTVGEVIQIDNASKAEPDAMLAWEHTATTLKPGFHIVYDLGGNLGDHWSVHAQLNGIAVVTSFKPYPGQDLPKMGQDLPPLEPQAIIFGFLGGLVSPSLAPDTPASRRKRTRATVAAILGTHHGMRMGGDGGVHLGASVALFLRLSQAALWGEARHAFSNAQGYDPALLPAIKPLKHLSRQQIFSQVLDDWSKGREGLRDVVRCFHLKWSGSFGGKAWAAIGHATVTLDTAMVELVRIPSRLNAKRVIAALTTAVNLAHNGIASGCFLNKFCTGDWFEMAAGLDPRAALMAGPIWYEATLADTGLRLGLLDRIEKMSPIEIGYPAPKGNVLHVTGAEGTVIKPTKGAQVDPIYVPHVPPPGSVPGGKVGSFDTVPLGSAASAAGIPGAPIKAMVKWGGNALHTQIELSAGGYVSGEIGFPNARWAAKVKKAVTEAPTGLSMSGSQVTYAVCTVTPEQITLGGIVLLTLGAETK